MKEVKEAEALAALQLEQVKAKAAMKKKEAEALAALEMKKLETQQK